MKTLGADFRENFRDNLKSFRLKKGLTQAELGLKANYDSTYVGKLERGASAPSFETIIRMGNALSIYPLKLLRPSRAHLDIRREIPEHELADLPYNPLDIQIFDSIPFSMGIITDEGTPVYINDCFVELTEIDREDIREQKHWELPLWIWEGFEPTKIIDSIRRAYADDPKVHYKLNMDSETTPYIDLFFYPTPVTYEPGEQMMWIFEIRDPEYDDVDFPLTVTSADRVDDDPDH